MTIEEFEKKINELVKRDEDGLIDDELNLHLSADGCLSGDFNGDLLPIEGHSWNEALDEIVRIVAGGGNVWKDGKWVLRNEELRKK